MDAERPTPSFDAAPRGAALQVDALAAADCDRIAERLFDVDAFWLARHPRFSFHTLGATHYYDQEAADPGAYDRRARQYNPFLRAHFGDVYQRLVDVLARALDAPVRLRDDVAWPGFQIFAAHAAFAARPEHDVMHPQWLARRGGERYPGNPIHVDTSHLCVPWPAGIEPRGLPTLSLTLPIRLPAGGAGLRLWACGDAELAGLDDAARLAALRGMARQELVYRPGRLVVHTGRDYHQALGLPSVPGDHRITLQGNALRVDGVWVLHW